MLGLRLKECQGKDIANTLFVFFCRVQVWILERTHAHTIIAVAKCICPNQSDMNHISLRVSLLIFPSRSKANQNILGMYVYLYSHPVI